MAESFLFSIAESLIEKLSSRAYEEALQAFNLREDLRGLKRTLSIVKAVLLDAEVKQDQTHGLREWLQQIKEVFSDAQDVLDEFECEDNEKRVLKATGSIKKKVSRFLSCSPLAFRFRMAREIKEIRKRLDEVAADRDKFGLERIDVDRRIVHRRDLSYSYVIPSDMIGREHDKEKIIDLLIQPHSDGDSSRGLSVIPIVGIGGLGKTTLAKLVFNDGRIDREFPLKMWVCVSNDFDIKQLVIKIINCVSVGQESLVNSDMEQLQTHLRDKLAGQKFLLILDDVWNEDRHKWMELKDLLEIGDKRSKTLLTTRSESIGSMMGTVSSFILSGLSYEDSLSLFVKWAFIKGQEEKYPNLLKIGEEIVRKCKGVPLAVKTLASSLFPRTNEEEWIVVRNSEMWNMKQTETDILPALKLSYDRMPSYLRQCFAFFSLYPQDFEFESIYITEIWVALGVIKSSDESDPKLEDVAKQYLLELHSRCFLQDFTNFGYFYTFKMHDMVHDLAVYVAKDEVSVVNSHTQNIHEKIRHLSVLENDPTDQGGQSLFNMSYPTRTKVFHFRPVAQGRKDFLSLTSFPRSRRMRTIMFTTEGVGIENEVLLNKWLSRYKYLRLLDLSDSSFEALPQSIGKLRHLRYLDLSFNKRIKRLPDSICELHSLQTLLLKGCICLQALPKGLRDLISLRQLVITLTSMRQSVLMDNDIAMLTSLRILSFEHCLNLESLFKGMQQLTSLQELGIHSCWRLKSLPVSVKHLPKLVALSIIDCDKLELFDSEDSGDLETAMKLKYVQFMLLPKLMRLPQWLKGAADTMLTLIIAYCQNLEVLPDWLPTSPHLNTLRIQGCYKLLSLPNDMKGFPALEILEIVYCPELAKKCEHAVGEYWPNISHIKTIIIRD